MMLAIGSYTPHTGGRGGGITLAQASPLRAIAHVEAASPSFLAWHPDGDVLYAAHETSPGAVSAFRVDGEALTLLGTVASEGDRPCHLAIDPAARVVAVSNYGSGTFALLPILDDDSLAETSQTLIHAGVGYHPTRQDRPHPHAVLWTSDGRLAVLADIGLDTVSVHRRADSTHVEEEPVSVTSLPPGSGPRHMTWIGDDLVAIVEEISATVSIHRLDGTTLQLLHRAPTSAHGADAWPSEIVAVDDRLVIANRTPGSISTLRSADGTIMSEVSLPPSNARHLWTDGRTALVALQDGDRIVLLDPLSGEATDALASGSPAYVTPRPPRLGQM